MNSDDDGDGYGYDIPEEGAGLGFSLSGTRPSHILGRDNNYQDASGGGGNSSSSAENESDEDDPNFAYGAYASRKRKQRERNSKYTDKEKNLYGVFYDSSDGDDGGRHNGNKRSRRSRHFDKQSNRNAGLAFVKASASSSGPATTDELGKKNNL